MARCMRSRSSSAHVPRWALAEHGRGAEVYEQLALERIDMGCTEHSPEEAELID